MDGSEPQEPARRRARGAGPARRRQKGSVPARTDTDRSKYTGYLAAAVAEWAGAGTRVVGSLTHGVVADLARNAAIDTAPAAFVQDKDAVRSRKAVAAART